MLTSPENHMKSHSNHISCHLTGRSGKDLVGGGIYPEIRSINRSFSGEEKERGCSGPRERHVWTREESGWQRSNLRSSVCCETLLGGWERGSRRVSSWRGERLQMIQIWLIGMRVRGTPYRHDSMWTDFPTVTGQFSYSIPYSLLQRGKLRYLEGEDSHCSTYLNRLEL